MAVSYHLNFRCQFLAKKYRANRYNIATIILTDCGHIVSLRTRG